MSKINLNKEKLLELTNGGQLYYKKVFPNLKKSSNEKYHLIRNHLRGEKNPSLSVYIKNGIHRHKDFGDDNYSGDIFNLYAIINGIDDIAKNFVAIMRGIYKEVFEEEPPKISRSKNNFEVAELPEGVEYKIEEKQFADLREEELAWLNEFNINSDIFEQLDFSFLNSYTFTSKNGKVFKISSVGSDFIIAAKYNNNCYKIYRPNVENKKYKFSILGEYSKDIYFGRERIIELTKRIKADKELYFDKDARARILLCSGLKDMLVANSLGFYAVCLNSETQHRPSFSMLEEIKEIQEVFRWRFEVHILYDLDKAGKEGAYDLNDSLDYFDVNNKVIQLPKKLSEVGGKDLADWMSLGLPVDELINHITDNQPEDFFIEGKVMSHVSSISPQEQNVENTPECDTEKQNQRLSKLKDYSKKIKLQKTEQSQADNIEVEEAELVVEDEISNNKVNESIKYNLTKEQIEIFPNFLQELIAPFEPRYKLMMTMSFLTALGSVYENVVGRFRRDTIYPNLFTVIVARAASGKSLMKWASHVIMPVEKYLQKQSKLLKKEYEEKKLQVAKKEITKEELGEEPPYKLKFLPTDITSSMWLQQVYENGGYGLMFDTEIDGLVESNNGKLRSFTDNLRKASEGERMSLMRRAEREHIIVEEGKISLLISGTPAQFFKLIPDSENGLFSRVLPITIEGNNSWVASYEESEFNYKSYYYNLSNKVLEDYEVLQQYETPIEIKPTDEQLQVLDKEFTKRLDQVKNIVGVDGRATVFRLGAITVKIAMILTIIRGFEEGLITPEIKCRDIDFKTSLLLTEIILNHVIKTLGNMNDERLENCFRGKKLDYYYSLPDKFTYSESQKVAELDGIKLRTAQKWIYEFRDKGFLVNPEKGQFKKI